MFATIDVFNFPTSKLPRNPYSEEEMNRISNAIEVVLEDVWIEALYGNKSTLLNDAWLEKVSKTKEGKFVFNATKLREALFDKANVEIKHLKTKTSAQPSKKDE